jgi:hypothetical protein
MSEDFNSRGRNLSSSARWLIATAAILVLLGFATICSTFWMFTSVILTDSCAQLPQWMGFYLVLPPAFLAVGALVPPILFATRKNLTLVMGSLVGSVLISFLLGIAWIPLVAIQC